MKCFSGGARGGAFLRKAASSEILPENHLHFRGQVVELGLREHGAVEAHELAAEVTAAADADTALHTAFEGGHDVFILDFNLFC